MPNAIKIYRMVHWSNVEHALRNGLCTAGHHLADGNYVAIGHRDLIGDRNIHQVPVGSGGTLGEYIPFYFAGHSPMLYAIDTGHKVKYYPQSDIVFIECDFDTVCTSGCEFCFTDRNAKISLANYFTEPRNVENLKWDYIQGRYWNNTEQHIKRQDYKQAEFLVKYHLDVNYIDQLWVKNQERKAYFEEIINNLALSITVNIDTNLHLYY
jgi:hypothetical protein